MHDHTTQPSAPAGFDGTPADGYLRVLRTRWRIVVAIALLVVAAAFGAQALRTPTYAATAHVLVAPIGQADTAFIGVRMLRDSGDPTRDMQTAAAVIQTPAAAQAVARGLGGGLDAEAVERVVTVEPLGESNIVSVTATDADPRRAARISTAYAEASLAERNRQLLPQIDAALATVDKSTPGGAEQRRQLLAVREGGDPTLSVAQPAAVPRSASGAGLALVIPLALIAGLVLGGVVAIVVERIDGRVRNRGELLDALPLPILTRVPRLPRGRGGFDVPPAVREAFRTLQLQLDLRGPTGCRRVVVTSASSGDGKTTTVLNLAFALVGAGHRVIVVDFDLRKPDLERQLGLEPSAGLVSLVTSDAPLSELLQAAPRLAPLRVVPAAGQAGDVAMLPILARRMESILAEAGELADYVIIDTAPLGEVGDALAVVEQADDLLIVGRPGSTDRRSLEVMVGLLERVGARPAGWIISGDSDGARTAYPDEVPPPSRRERRRERVSS